MPVVYLQYLDITHIEHPRFSPLPNQEEALLLEEELLEQYKQPSEEGWLFCPNAYTGALMGRAVQVLMQRNSSEDKGGDVRDMDEETNISDEDGGEILVTRAFPEHTPPTPR